MQAVCAAASIWELGANVFGPHWIATGCLSTAVIRPVIVWDTITASGLVTRVEDEGDRKRLWLEVWCKNERGELVTMGRASALRE